MGIRYKNLFENKRKAIKPLNLRIQTLLNVIKINPKITNITICSKIAPWIINQSIRLELTKLSQTKTYPIIFQEKFLNIQNNFPDHLYFYTVVSKQGRKIGCAASLQKQKLLKHLSNEPSIRSTEITSLD